jgi:hypothetical protein
MSEEKVGEANAGFERYAKGVKPLLDARTLASGIIQQAKEAGTKVMRCATCRNSYTSKSVGEPCSFCATAIKALVAWREADRKVVEVTGLSRDSTVLAVAEIRQRDVTLAALRAAADALTQQGETGG